ncbi:MAG: hypothetical protein RIA64_00315 [Rhodospirillales bacterium]
MSRGPSTFRQSTVTKAIKAAKAAGVDVARIEVDPDGRVVLTVGKPDDLIKPDVEMEIEL